MARMMIVPADLHRQALRNLKMDVVISKRMIGVRQAKLHDLRTNGSGTRGNHLRYEIEATVENLIWWQRQDEVLTEWKELIDSFTE